MKVLKTSITLDANILQQIEEYSRKQKEIPEKSEAIRNLIRLGLKAYNIEKPKMSKEPKREVPKDSLVIVPKESTKSVT